MLAYSSLFNNIWGYCTTLLVSILTWSSVPSLCYIDPFCKGGIYKFHSDTLNILLGQRTLPHIFSFQVLFDQLSNVQNNYLIFLSDNSYFYSGFPLDLHNPII